MEHQITPPPELVQQWVTEACPECRLTYDEFTGESVESLATAAAQWGADQELEACCEWLDFNLSATFAYDLRAARRPKPLSEANQALADLDALVADLSNHGMGFKATNLRRALERLKELEGQGNG